MSSHSLWTDVRVSAVHTEALVQELLASAAAVEAAMHLLAPGGVAADDWGGPHRLVFDHERDRLLRRGQDLSSALVATAGTAATLLAAGEGEQRLRAQLRHRLEVAARPDHAR